MEQHIPDLEQLMPYRSDAQRRWAHTPNGMKSLGGADKVAEWDSASKGMKLPERVRGPNYKRDAMVAALKERK